MNVENHCRIGNLISPKKKKRIGNFIKSRHGFICFPVLHKFVYQIGIHIGYFLYYCYNLLASTREVGIGSSVYQFFGIMLC